MIVLSEDGYVRLSFAEIQSVPLVHRISGLDEPTRPADSTGGLQTSITGYTEWVSTTDPVITLGWDWQMEAAHHTVSLRRTSDPRSNVMLLDPAGADLGPARTLVLLGALVDALKWESDVQRNISVRYG